MMIQYFSPHFVRLTFSYALHILGCMNHNRVMYCGDPGVKSATQIRIDVNENIIAPDIQYICAQS